MTSTLWVLFIIRLLLLLSTGYIHPDEHFQVGFKAIYRVCTIVVFIFITDVQKLELIRLLKRLKKTEVPS